MSRKNPFLEWVEKELAKKKVTLTTAIPPTEKKPSPEKKPWKVAKK